MTPSFGRSFGFQFCFWSNRAPAIPYSKLSFLPNSHSFSTRCLARLAHQYASGAAAFQREAESREASGGPRVPYGGPAEAYSTLTLRGRSSGSDLFQNLHRLANLCDSEDQEGCIGVGLSSTVAEVAVDTREC